MEGILASCGGGEKIGRAGFAMLSRNPPAPNGALLPAIAMLEKLGFQSLVERTLTSQRIPRAMDLYQFVLGLYIGYALHRHVARQILTIVRTRRDAAVHTLYGQQMGGGKSYNPKNKGKKSYRPMLTFIAGTREYVWSELRNGDPPTGQRIGDRLRNLRHCPAAGQIRDFTVRARRPARSSNRAKPSGSHRPRRMPSRSVSSPAEPCSHTFRSSDQRGRHTGRASGSTRDAGGCIRGGLTDAELEKSSRAFRWK
jgi:hypothetical protein